MQGGTRSFSQAGRVLGASSRRGTRTETVRLRDTGRGSRWAFAVVLNDTTARELDVRYRLRFERAG